MARRRAGRTARSRRPPAWCVLGEKLIRQAIESVGTASRPWAWWVFEQGEERPRSGAENGDGDDEAELARLAELGVLEEHEIERLRLRAADSRPLIGTPGEHWYWPKKERGDSVERRDARHWEIVRRAVPSPRMEV